MIPLSRKSLKTFNVTIAAGAQERITVNGNFIHYTDGNGTVNFTTPEGLNIIRDVGGSVNCSQFEHVFITNNHTSSDLKTLTIGYGELRDNAVSGSVDVDEILTPVEVLNREEVSTLDSKMFSAGAHTSVGSGNYPQHGLYNPVGSGKLLLVKRYLATSYVASTQAYFALLYYAIADPLTDSWVDNSSLTARNNYLGGSNPLATFWVKGNSTIPGTRFKQYDVPAYGTGCEMITVPYIVPEGFMLIVANKYVSTCLAGGFEWEEI